MICPFVVAKIVYLAKGSLVVVPNYSYQGTIVLPLKLYVSICRRDWWGGGGGVVGGFKILIICLIDSNMCSSKLYLENAQHLISDTDSKTIWTKDAYSYTHQPGSANDLSLTLRSRKLT